ncbi:MAG: NYN domain-containing protein [Clostridiales bacterium]|nr:NYN domain-containing protein [Clostridiales bacterium]
MQEKKFAVLIDGDNTSYQYIDTIMSEANKVGTVTYKRIYGDWTAPNLNSWKDILLSYSISPIQQYSYTKGKNATDSAMIIDAMDILYAGNVQGFCLVSSDSDFTKLAARLREAGMEVIGMGKQQTPKAFISACSTFKYVDLINNNQTQNDNRQLSKKSINVPKAIKNAIDEMFADANPEGWLLVSSVGQLLSRQYNDFDYRNYGYNRMIDLLKAIGYEIKVSNDKTTYSIKKR